MLKRQRKWVEKAKTAKNRKKTIPNIFCTKLSFRTWQHKTQFSYVRAEWSFFKKRKHVLWLQINLDLSVLTFTHSLLLDIYLTVKDWAAYKWSAAKWKNGEVVREAQWIVKDAKNAVRGGAESVCLNLMAEPLHSLLSFPDLWSLLSEPGKPLAAEPPPF